MNFNELYPKKKEYYYLLMDIKTTAECNGFNYVIDKQKAKLLMRYINKKEKEIKRLNYKLQQKENIIKEVREYVKKNMKTVTKEQAEGTRLPVGTFMWNVDKILEILDKID